MFSAARSIGKYCGLDSTKRYQISRPLESQNFEIRETRQSVHYAHLSDLYLHDKEAFAGHVNPPCALADSRRVLTRLFEHSSINEKLLRIFKFRGLAKQCTWTSLGVFCELLDLVPQELERKLDHLALFWEGLCTLVESPDDIYRDEVSSPKISGLWPSKCESDVEKLLIYKESKKFFPMVKTPATREAIVDKIRTLDHRVPTFAIVISESRVLQQLASLICKTLEPMGKGFCLEKSRLIWKGHRANNHQYLRCFLAAARVQCDKSHNKLIDELRHVFNSSERKSSPLICAAALVEVSSFRRVSAYPNGIWSSVAILPQLLDEGVLSMGPMTGVLQPELSMVWLLQDFLRSFFKAEWLNSHYETNVEYYPFIVDIPSLENENDLREVLCCVVGATEPRESCDSVRTFYDVRKRAELVLKIPVQSVHPFIENVSSGQSSSKNTLRQESNELTENATKEDSHWSDWTPSSTLNIEQKTSPNTRNSWVSGETRPHSLVDLTTSGAASRDYQCFKASDYQSIVVNQKKQMNVWASSEETLLGVTNIQEGSSEESKLKQSKTVLNTDETWTIIRQSNTRNVTNSFQQLRPRRKPACGGWSSGEDTIVEVDTNKISQTINENRREKWDVQAQRNRLKIGIVKRGKARKITRR